MARPHRAGIAAAATGLVITLTTERPGLSSELHAQAGADEPVAIFAEGKEHAMAVGITKMSTQAMRDANKGIGVDNLHFLTDGLWRLPRVD